MKLVRPLIIPSPFVVASHQLTTSNISESEYSAWAVGTAYVVGNRVQIVDPTATVTITAAVPGVVTFTAHGLPVNSPIRITTTGALLTGLTAGTVYYTRDHTVNTFTLSLTPGGAPLNTSGTQSGTHTAVSTRHDVYECLINDTGSPPALNATIWAYADATNKWRLHNGLVSSKTSNITSIDNTYTLDGRANSVALLAMDGATVQVIMTDSVEGEVYNVTKSGVSSSGIIDHYEWWTEDPVRITELLFEDLPSYSGATIRVIITATNETVLCGVLVIGNDLELGCTLHGMGLSIQDFSIKQTDAFGNTSVLERAFKREVTARVIADNDSVDAIFNELAKLRARPTVYVGSTDFGASMAYGFFKDFNIDVALPTKSFISIEIEGLT